jgi:hypothetical protein
MLKVLLAYAGAVVGAYVLGSILATQLILGNVQAMGMNVTGGVRLEATVHDILGLAASYLPLMAVAFLIALPVATGLRKVLSTPPLVLYVLAGAVAVVTLHLTMKAVLGLTGIAATRTIAGLWSQGLAGALGGYLYYKIRFAASVTPAAGE